MTTGSPSALLQQPPETEQNDEIDFGEVASTLYRRWRLVAGITAGTTIAAALVTVAQKPVWEGEFQIVVANRDEQQSRSSELFASNSALATLIGANSNGNELETEVKILKSPLVLKPVFDFVLSSKSQAGQNVDDLRFAKWLKKDLDIKLEKGTSVLNLTYRDTDKALIIPVIDRISKAYQAYSGRDRQRSLARGVAYLDQQIKIYRERSIQSLRAAQQYAIEQDLTALKDDNETRNTLNLEAIRVQAANEIRNYNEQLKQLATLGNDSDAIQYRGLTIPELASKGLPQQIEAINVQLATLRQTFTDKEPTIKNLVRRRQLMIDVFKRNTINFLLAKRADAQARLAASQRPKGVLIRYRELLRISARDETTLNKLEDERRAVALEKARSTAPWELISTPTLLDRPVAPRKTTNLALGLLAGLVLGSGSAIIADRRSGRVYSRRELLRLLPYPLLVELDPSQPDSWSIPLDLLADGPLQAVGSVALIPIGDGDVKETAQQLSQALQRSLQHASPGGEPPTVIASDDLLSARRADKQLLVTSTGEPTREELMQLSQQLELQGHPVSGLLLLRPGFRRNG